MTSFSPEYLDAIEIWGYPMLFLLMIIEGPIATIIGAFLASLGIFNIGIIFLLSIAGDIIGDIILYYIGRLGGRKTLLKAEKVLDIKQSIVKKLEAKFQRSGAKIIFTVKSTTGLCWITFILAGTVKMDIRKFLKYSFLGGLVWSSFLVIMGYFFGYAADQINQYITYAGYLLLLLVIIFFIAINLYRRTQTAKFLGPKR